jgi:hypothetical protein
MDNVKLLSDAYRWAPAKAVTMGDELVKLRNTRPVWEVIEAVMKMYSETNVHEYQSFLVDLKDTKDLGKVTNVGGKAFSNVSKDINGATLRHRLDIPVKVVYIIRRLYSVEELPMDEKFYAKWARMFPRTVVSEVV